MTNYLFIFLFIGSYLLIYYLGNTLYTKNVAYFISESDLIFFDKSNFEIKIHISDIQKISHISNTAISLFSRRLDREIIWLREGIFSWGYVHIKTKENEYVFRSLNSWEFYVSVSTLKNQRLVNAHLS